MKTNRLLILAGLVVLLTSTYAAESQTETDSVILPPAVVIAPRHLEIEQRITASLDEFLQRTTSPLFDVSDLAVLNASAKPTIQSVHPVKNGKAILVAKL